MDWLNKAASHHRKFIWFQMKHTQYLICSMYFRFRFLCKALAGYVLAQLPERRGEPQSVRCFAGASGPVGQPGGNSECAKVLLKLDAGVAELKPHVELALKQVSHPHNEICNV